MKCVRTPELCQASSLHEVDLHGLMLVTMKELDSYIKFLAGGRYYGICIGEKCVKEQNKYT